MGLHHVAFFVFYDAFAMQNVGVLEPHVAAHTHAEVFFVGLLAEVLALDVNLAPEADLAGAGGFRLRIIDGGQALQLILRVVGDDHFERVQHGHTALGQLVELGAHAEFQQLELDQIFAPGYTRFVAEGAQRGGRVAPAAHPRDGGHPGVVPAGHHVLLYQ